MRALVASIVLCIAATAKAQQTSWSAGTFDLPAGYAEQPGAGDSLAATLRGLSNTVSVDVQVFVAADGNVQLTRTLWLRKPDDPPTRQSVEATAHNLVSGGRLVDAKHISDSVRVEGDLVVLDSVDEKASTHFRQRRLLSADTSNIVYIFGLSCAAPIGTAMPECEHALDTMQLSFPTQVKLRDEPDTTLLQLVLFVAFGLVAVGYAVVTYRRTRRTTSGS